MDRVDEEELHACFKQMNVEITGKKLRKMIAMFDDDGSGEIEFDEFVALIDKLRRGKFGGLGDVFSGASKKMKNKGKKKKGKKVVPSGKGDEEDKPAAGRPRRVFPKLQEWITDHNLTQYTQTLRLAGFKETKTLLLIKEEDLDTLGFKTGHKRKLLAAIKRLRDGLGKPQTQAAINKRKRIIFSRLKQAGHTEGFIIKTPSNTSLIDLQNTPIGFNGAKHAKLVS